MTRGWLASSHPRARPLGQTPPKPTVGRGRVKTHLLRSTASRLASQPRLSHREPSAAWTLH